MFTMSNLIMSSNSLLNYPEDIMRHRVYRSVRWLQLWLVLEWAVRSRDVQGGELTFEALPHPGMKATSARQVPRGFKILPRRWNTLRNKLAKLLLSEQKRKLLVETRDILEELLETEQVLRDKALMKSIKDSHGDVKAGRLYTIEQLKKQLRTEFVQPCFPQ